MEFLRYQEYAISLCITDTLKCPSYAFNFNFPSVVSEIEYTGKDLYQGGFSRAVLSGDRVHFACFEDHRYVAKRTCAAEPLVQA